MRIYRNRLRPLPADPKAYNHAKELAKSWRKTGLTVDLVEYYAMPGESEPGGYVLTGRSNTTVISYRCQSWLYRRGFWGGRPLWTIEITVRPGYPEADVGQPLPAAREAGFAAAWDPEGAWSLVQEWIDDGSPLPATLDAALAAMRKPASWLARRAGPSGANRRAHDRRRDGNPG